MTDVTKRQETPAPFLTASDVERPLEFAELVDAASILTQAGQEPDDTAQEAVGFYRRKEMQRLMGNAAFDASRLAERLERLEARLPKEIEESDLLSKLVSDLVQARIDTEDGFKLPDIFGFRARRQERERIEALREKAAIDERIDITDLHEGDKVTFHSVLPVNQDKASQVLKGKVIGFKDTEQGKAALLRVEKETRHGKLDFSTAQRNPGAVARLIGTCFWTNRYRPHPSSIAQGDALEFVDVEGKAYMNGAYIEGKSYMRNPLGMRLLQMEINGTDIFPKKD
jgi:hypothetical protein